MINVLMPSIVNPAVQMGGAWTATRGLLDLLGRTPLRPQIECVAARRYSAVEHRLRQIAAIGRASVSDLPAKIAFSRSRRMSHGVNRLLSSKEFDLVLINGGDLMWLAPQLPEGIPKVLVAHNLEHRLYADQIESRSPRIRWARRFLENDCDRLRDYEFEGFRSLRNVLFLSADDEACVREHCAGLNALTVPPVFGGQAARRRVEGASPGVLKIAFLANFTWWPNREGCRWFLQLVFPHVSERFHLHLFGYGSETVARGHPGVTGHGWVTSLDDVWNACDFVICPTRCGSGVSVKLAETVYYRVPVLATRRAAHGLPLDPDPAIVLLDDAEEWVAFLRSDAVVGFARSATSPHLANRFSIDVYAPTVMRFLGALLEA